MRNMYIRTNTLLRRFVKCSKKVKVRLFRSYCLCLYGLWNTYTVNCMKKKLRRCYHRCIKSFLFMIDCIMLQLFSWICSFLAFTLFCITINFRSVCSSLAVVTLLLNILSVLKCDVCMFLLQLLLIAFIIITYLLRTLFVWNKTWLADWLIDWLTDQFRLNSDKNMSQKSTPPRFCHNFIKYWLFFKKF